MYMGEREPIKGQYAPVIGLFLRQKKNGQPMSVVGDGLQSRDFTHVKDVVEVNILASLCKNIKCLGKVINIGSGCKHTILELVKMIGGKYNFIPPREGEATTSLADISLAKKIT